MFCLNMLLVCTVSLVWAGDVTEEEPEEEEEESGNLDEEEIRKLRSDEVLSLTFPLLALFPFLAGAWFQLVTGS